MTTLTPPHSVSPFDMASAQQVTEEVINRTRAPFTLLPGCCQFKFDAPSAPCMLFAARTDDLVDREDATLPELEALARAGQAAIC